MDVPVQTPSTPTTNESIAKQLLEMAKLHAGDTFRVRAYKNAAKAIKSYPYPITSGAKAKSIPGVGSSTADKIDEILRSGQIQVLAQRTSANRERTAAIDLFKSIHGVGNATAETWYDLMGYRTLQDLVPAYNAGQFTAAQRLGMYYYTDLLQRIPREEMDKIALYLRGMFAKANVDFIIAGSYRRKLPTSGDVDVLMKAVNRDGVRLNMESIVQLLVQSGFLIGDLTPKAVVKFMGICRLKAVPGQAPYPARRIDIRLVEPEIWPFAVLHSTGTDTLNVKMRNRALQFGLSLSEYGLVDNITKQPFPPVESGIKIQTEKDIFDILKIKYLEPEERTDTVNLEFTDQPPPIVQPSVMQPLLQKETGKWYRPVNSLLINVGDRVMSLPGSHLPTGKIIAGFDLDGTLIHHLSGKTFSSDLNDLAVLPNRIPVLQSLIERGFTIVIFSNQKSKSPEKENAVFNKLNKALALLNLPVILLAALGDDQYRKPQTGMWTEALTVLGHVDASKSFFCGDAAGRPGDFAASDLEFAKNIGIPFYTPEQIFTQ